MLDRTSSLPLPASSIERRDDTLVALVPTLRATLERERDFRRDQLAQLDPPERTLPAPSPVDHPVDRSREAAVALHEVDALIAAGARRALADIELALARMRTGGYGDCRTCGVGIPLVVLEAIPETTVCLACRGSAAHAEWSGVAPEAAAATC